MMTTVNRQRSSSALRHRLTCIILSKLEASSECMSQVTGYAADYSASDPIPYTRFNRSKVAHCDLLASRIALITYNVMALCV